MITMNNNSAVVDYDNESESAQSVSDDTQNTDFTQVASCAFGGEPVEPGNRQARSDLILGSIAIEEEGSGSLKLFFERVFGIK